MRIKPGYIAYCGLAVALLAASSPAWRQFFGAELTLDELLAIRCLSF
jgi:hypothetical protein